MLCMCKVEVKVLIIMTCRGFFFSAILKTVIYLSLIAYNYYMILIKHLDSKEILNFDKFIMFFVAQKNVSYLSSLILNRKLKTVFYFTKKKSFCNGFFLTTPFLLPSFINSKLHKKIIFIS